MVASPAPAAAPPASPAAASKEPHDQEQQYRADGGVDDCTDQSRTEMNTQLRQQPTSDKGAQNPEQEITEYPKTSPLHDLTCQPASNETHKQYDQQAFARNIHCATSALWVQPICCRLFDLIVYNGFAFRKDCGQSIAAICSTNVLICCGNRSASPANVVRSSRSAISSQMAALQTPSI
jgi:hypothetical protein